MIHLLSVLVPVALAAGVSPMMFSEQLLLLGTSDGRRAGRRYLAGTATVLAVLIAAVVTLGGSLALPHAPTLSAGLDVVLGLTLLAVAVLVHLRRPRPRRRKNTRGSQAAFGFGVFSMATNFTTLPLVIRSQEHCIQRGVGVLAGHRGAHPARRGLPPRLAPAGHRPAARGAPNPRLHLTGAREARQDDHGCGAGDRRCPAHRKRRVGDGLAGALLRTCGAHRSGVRPYTSRPRVRSQSGTTTHNTRSRAAIARAAHAPTDPPKTRR